MRKLFTVLILSAALVSCGKDNIPASVSPPVPQAVDLGLSVKWASFNLGASAPQVYGSYFAWGEKAAKTSYTWENYAHCDGSKDKILKYNATDGLLTLESADDAATAILGPSWSIPTQEQWVELRQGCDWEWTQLEGVYGYKISAKAQGNTNSIFLPAAGGYQNSTVYAGGSRGLYWSAELYQDRPEDRNPVFPRCAKVMNFSSDNTASPGNAGAYTSRFYGLSVRAVCK